MLSIKQKTILPERVVILGSGGFISNALEDLLVKSKINFIAYKREDLDLAKDDSASILVKNLKTTDVVIFIAAKAPVKDEGMLIFNLQIGKTICAIKVKEVERPVIENRGVYDCVTQDGDIATRAVVAHNEQLERELKEQQAMLTKQKTELSQLVKN